MICILFFVFRQMCQTKTDKNYVIWLQLVGVMLESPEFAEFVKGPITFSLKSVDCELNFAIHFISLLLSHCYKIFSFTKLECNSKLKMTLNSGDLVMYDFDGRIVSYYEYRLIKRYVFCTFCYFVETIVFPLMCRIWHRNPLRK